jgi:hypothetical protein
MRKVGSFFCAAILGVFISLGAASLVGALFPGLGEASFLLFLGYWVLSGRQHISAIDLSG